MMNSALTPLSAAWLTIFLVLDRSALTYLRTVKTSRSEAADLQLHELDLARGRSIDKLIERA